MICTPALLSVARRHPFLKKNKKKKGEKKLTFHSRWFVLWHGCPLHYQQDFFNALNYYRFNFWKTQVIPKKTNDNQLLNTCKDLRFNFWHYYEATQSLPNTSGVKGTCHIGTPGLWGFHPIIVLGLNNL